MKRRILIVDDDIDFSFLMKVTLELEGQYEVKVVVNPMHAVTAARGFKPALILLDCMMPHMDGEEVASAMRGDPALKEVPIAFLTATVFARRDEARDGRVETYLPKTLPTADLVKFIMDVTSAGDAPAIAAG